MATAEQLIAIKGTAVASLPPTATVLEAAQLMNDRHIGSVLVIDQDHLVGIFTERDVLFRIVDRGRNPATLPLADVMTPDPEALSVRSTVAYALNKMCVGGFRHVPVVDEEHRPAFVVSVRDVVEYLVESFPSEILNLPPEDGPERYTTRDGA